LAEQSHLFQDQLIRRFSFSFCPHNAIGICLNHNMSSISIERWLRVAPWL
jgi:hypothetical protein